MLVAGCLLDDKDGVELNSKLESARLGGKIATVPNKNLFYILDYRTSISHMTVASTENVQTTFPILGFPISSLHTFIRHYLYLHH